MHISSGNSRSGHRIIINNYLVLCISEGIRTTTIIDNKVALQTVFVKLIAITMHYHAIIASKNQHSRKIESPSRPKRSSSSEIDTILINDICIQ